MKDFKCLPVAVLVLCLASGVNSVNTPITNRTTTASTTSDTSNSATITAAPTTISSGTEVPHTFTGTDVVELVDWCFSDYGSYLNASGTPSVYTSSGTETVTAFPENTPSLSTFSFTYTVTTTLVPVPYEPPPQCYTGCVIEGDRVRLEYWTTSKVNGTAVPNPTITPAPSVVVDGLSLVSPSNYLVFTGISAVRCPLGGSPCTTIGESVDNATLSFGQNELMTENCFHAFDTFNYADFQSPIPWSIVSTQIGCTLITESHPGNEPDYDFTLMPNILYPSAVRTAINPDWASCTFVNAAYDPPSALTPVQQLTSAAPGTTADPPVPPPTATLTASIPPVESQTSPPLETPDPPASPSTSQDPVPPITTTEPPQAPPPTTAVSDPPASPASSALPVPPAVSEPVPPVSPTSTGLPAPPAVSDPVPPVSPTSTGLPAPPVISDPAPPVEASSPIIPADPTTSDPPTSVKPPAQTPPVESLSQPQGQPSGGNTGLGSIIASVGGISAPRPGSTITLPGGVISAPSVPTTVGGQLVSIVPGSVTTIPGGVTSIGGIATTLPGITVTGVPASSPPVIATIGENTITIAPDGGSAIVGTQTLTAGGDAITVSGTVVSLGPSSIVVGSSTIALAAPTDPATSFAGYNITTASPSGPVQASSGPVFNVPTGWICSVAWIISALLIFTQV